MSVETLETSERSESALPFSSDDRLTPFTSFLDSDDVRPAAVRNGLGDRISARTGHEVPKFKSMPPPVLPISSPPAFSPSSFFALPPGLSPSELLDSPVLLSASNNLASPTTGTFHMQESFNNRCNMSQLKDIKEEPNTFPHFSFQPQTNPLTSYEQQHWGFLDSLDPPFGSSDKPNFETMTLQSHEPNMDPNQPSQDTRESEDGYNWRKYGQKHVKGSENPRSYYKCTVPNCPAKKKVERSFDGKIAEIVIRGCHNHPMPQSTRKSSSSSSSSSSSASSVVIQSKEISHPSNNVVTHEDSSLSNGDLEMGNRRSVSGGDEDEPDAKRWKCENGSDDISVMGSRTVRTPKVIVQTMSDVDVLDDGYRWRKYGQKVVKGNPNPRSYYKCTSGGCQVRKHVERGAHDSRAVITTYEGKHNHQVPPAQSRSNDNNNNNNNKNVALGILGSDKSGLENFSLQEYDGAMKDERVDDGFADSFLCW